MALALPDVLERNEIQLESERACHPQLPFVRVIVAINVPPDS
jgi:hypothetical protein